MKNFLDFLKNSRKSASSDVQMLTEAKIVSSKNQFWPKFSIQDFLKIAEYSTTWNSKSSLGTLKIKATESELDTLSAVIETITTSPNWSSEKDLSLSYKKAEKSSSVLFRIQGENGAGFEDQLNAIVDKFNGDGCQASYDKVEKPLLVTLEDPVTGKKKKVPDPSGKKILIQSVLKAKGPKDKMQELNDTLDQLGIEGANLSLKSFDPNTLIDGQLAGDFDLVSDALVELLKIQKKPDDLQDSSIAKYLNENFEFKQDLDPDTKWIVQCAYKSIYNPSHTDDPHFDSVDQFCQFLENKNVSLALVNFNYERSKELKTLANKQEEAKKEFFKDKETDAKGKPIFDKAKLSSILANVEQEVKSNWKIGKTIIEIPSIKTLFKTVGLEDEEEKQDDNQKNLKKIDIKFVDNLEFNTSSAGERCAQRRMKLFAAAEKRGAKVLKTSSYVAAICTNASQVAPFCRLKPKVKPGTNEIDPDCNLEDWEGITPENKAKRDDSTGKYETIRDGIDDGFGHSFDRLTGEYGQSMNGVQFAEASWCVGGAQSGKFSWDYTGNQGAFSNYTENGKRPMVVFMPVKRGALYLYAKFLKNGIILENILNENEKCDGAAPKSSNPTDSAQQQFCNKFASTDLEFKKIKNYIEKQYYPDFETEIDEEDPVFNTANPGGKCAQRRMKLFAAAEHYGAKIIKTKNWVAAICTAGAQAHQFGRLKPIVKPGTNEIDPDCNLEDWEGITSENKTKRDDYDNGNRIKDGIDDGFGKSFDRLKSVSAQSPTVKYAESAWCVCGACSNKFKWDASTCSYFDSYSDGGKNAIVVFMSTKRGTMYMYSCAKGNEQFDNESDCIDGSNVGCPGSSQQRAFLAKMKSSDSDFNVLHTKIFNTYFKKTGNSNSQSMSPEQLLEYAKSNGLMKKNGWLIINDHANAVKFQPIYDRVAGIAVTAPYGDNLFQGVDLSLVDTIDFSKRVKSAYQMFKGANIGSLRILNSENVNNICEMFHSAILENLLQFDTSHVQSANSAFYEARPSKGQSLKLPVFNLQCCRDITSMFAGTNVQEINIQNVQNVERASGAYAFCPKLASYPETKFPKIFDIKYLTTDGSRSAAMMFTGCLTLQSKKKRMRLNTNPDFDFDAAIKDTEKFYEDQKAIKDASKIDSRGFLKISSVNDIYDSISSFHKFPGVVVELEDASSLFKNQQINIKVLDLHLVKNASSMFQSASIGQIQDIIGTESIEIADYMFYKCDARVLPDIEFSKLVSCKLMFGECNQLKELPSVTITGGSNMLFNLTFDYVFGSQSSLTKMLAAVGGVARIETWLNNQKTNLEDFVWQQFEMHDGKISVSSKEVARLIVKDWPLIQKKTKASGIFLNVEDASEFFRNFNTQEDLSMPVLDFQKVKTANYTFSNVKVKNFEGILNFGGVTSAIDLFNGCRVLDGTIPEFDVSNVENARRMFYYCKTSKPMKTSINFKKATYTDSAFYNAKVFTSSQDIGEIKIPIASSCVSMFDYMETIDNGNLTCSKVDLPNVEQATCLFNQAAIKGVVEEVNLPKATNIASLFAGSHVEEVQVLRAPLAKQCNCIFDNCIDLKLLGTVELPLAISLNKAFYNTQKLQKIMIPRFNSSGYNFTADQAFTKSNLVTVFGVKMEKWKSISTLFEMMSED